MLRRGVITNVAPLRGGPRPWKKRGMPVAVHAAQRPGEPSDVEFDKLNLNFGVSIDLIQNSAKWTPAPKDTPKLPFLVERTIAGSALPVYTDYRAGRTKVVTILRRCKGDIAALKDDLERVVGREVLVKPGKLEVVGNYHMRIKKWLVGLGF